MHTGTSFDNTFVDNWLKGNNQLNDGSPELLVQYYASNDTFEHNTIIATNSAHVVYGTVPGGAEHGNVSNDNIFSAVGSALGGRSSAGPGTSTPGSPPTGTPPARTACRPTAECRAGSHAALVSDGWVRRAWFRLGLGFRRLGTARRFRTGLGSARGGALAVPGTVTQSRR